MVHTSATFRWNVARYFAKIDTTEVLFANKCCYIVIYVQTMHWASRKSDGLMLLEKDKDVDSEKNEPDFGSLTWSSERADGIISDFRNYRIWQRLVNISACISVVDVLLVKLLFLVMQVFRY